MNLGRRRLAFTLIELLVVIAIIAILAAILFPVFAQAKVAAKKATALSDVKQLNLAQIMYQNDYDDMIVPKLRLGFGPSDGGNDPKDAMTWEVLCYPYMKNLGLIKSPVDPNPTYKTPYGTTRRSYGAASNFFRAVQVKPGKWGDFVGKGAISATSVPQPADTITFGERRQCPDSAAADPWNSESWFWCVEMNHTRQLQEEYGEISYSYNDGAIWGYSDGHVNFKRKNANRQSDGKLIGTKFPGYEEKAAWWVGSPDPYWDTGLSCFDSGWGQNDGDCKLPGQ